MTKGIMICCLCCCWCAVPKVDFYDGLCCSGSAFLVRLGWDVEFCLFMLWFSEDCVDF